MVDLSKREFLPRVCRSARQRTDVLDRDDAVTAWRFWHTARPYMPAGALTAPIAALDLSKPGADVTVFNDGVTRAVCVTRGHPAPHYRCLWCIRGMHDLEQLLKLLRHLGTVYAAYAVIGQVRLYGRMQDEANGDDWPGTVRGEYAELTTTGPLFASPILSRSEADTVARRYGVTVERGRRTSGDPAACIEAWLDSLP